MLYMNNLLSSKKHLMKGSPVYPLTQLHIGLWFTTWQCALIPHIPGQGSWHFWLIHALSERQSELTIHSGRQFGGDPTQISRHVQTACPLNIRHVLYGPQGEGLQGSTDSEIAK